MAVPRSQNTSRSQNAALGARPLPFPSGERPPHPAGWETWALARSFRPRKRGLMTGVEGVGGEKGGGEVQVPPEISILRPARGRGIASPSTPR